MVIIIIGLYILSDFNLNIEFFDRGEILVLVGNDMLSIFLCF